MPDKSLNHLASEPPATGVLANCYLVHAAVIKVSAQANAPDEALLGKLIRRRLSRLERVLAAHGGLLVRQPAKCSGGVPLSPRFWKPRSA